VKSHKGFHWPASSTPGTYLPSYLIRSHQTVSRFLQSSWHPSVHSFFISFWPNMRTQRAAAGAAALTLLALCPTTLALPGSGVLQARAECKAYKIQSGDSCWKIAEERCSPKISTSDLYKFNSGLEAKCSNLKVRDLLLAGRGFFLRKPLARRPCLLHCGHHARHGPPRQL